MHSREILFNRKIYTLKQEIKHYEMKNMPTIKTRFLTDREKKILEAIDKHLYVKDAAHALGLTPRTVYNVLYRLRNKYIEARWFVNIMLAYKRKSKLLNRVLTKRVPIEKLEKILGTRPIDLTLEEEE